MFLYGQSAEGIFYQMFFLILFSGCLLLACYKLFQFISAYGPELSVTQVCLEMEILASISKCHAGHLNLFSSYDLFCRSP